MKKLMIAAAVVCAAAMVQAASITWSTGAMETIDGDYLGYYDANMYVWMVDSTVFNNTSVDSIIGTYAGKDTYDYSGPVSSKNDKFTVASTKKDYGVGDYYSIILMEYDDGDGNMYYKANKSIATVTKIGDGDPIDASVGALDSLIGGDGKAFTGSGAAVADWQSVPEPTSGLLLLLGVAGLALRRRRA